MNRDFIVPGGGKGTLHVKSVSVPAGTANSGSKTYDVISTFGISEKALKSLSSENFIGKVRIVKYPSAAAANANVTTIVDASYNSENHTVTAAWSSSYKELQFPSIVLYAFWVE